MPISLDELKIQVALGTIDEKIRSQLWQTEDKEVLKILGGCADIEIRRTVSINPHTSFSMWRKMYEEDSDYMVRELAWSRFEGRFKRLFGYDPPEPPWKAPYDNRPSDLPSDTHLQ